VQVFVATRNPGKLRELQALFAPYGWTLRAYAAYAEVEETADSYEANAAIKARALHDQLKAAGKPASVIGDDSGLEVAALDNRPGVYSARYGPDGATWHERRRLLLEETAAARRGRQARFVCVLHHIGADGTETGIRGTVEGLVSREERGEGGFSYDAIFEYPPLGRTFAELSAEEKNAVSHRAAAAKSLIEKLSG